jgi:hypothetical protein
MNEIAEIIVKWGLPLINEEAIYEWSIPNRKSNRSRSS